MTVDVKENSSPDELLTNFQSRYQALLDENKSLSTKIRDNETTALKLLGAIETLQYLYPHTPEGQAEEAPGTPSSVETTE
jgi:hypothetical protein|tara:strand:- start:3012 stop:3251 length:240 start_codon:yes stop_codon:yes gene_type:complete